MMLTDVLLLYTEEWTSGLIGNLPVKATAGRHLQSSGLEGGVQELGHSWGDDWPMARTISTTDNNAEFKSR